MYYIQPLPTVQQIWTFYKATSAYVNDSFEME